MVRLLFLLIYFILIIGCNNSSPNLVKLDLLPYGEAISIMAPENANVRVAEYGLMKDITVQDSLNYNLQIFVTSTNTFNLESAVTSQQQVVENAPYFDKIIQADDSGFIYQKKIDSTLIRYDFRYVKIQGDKQYVFQPSLSGGHEKADVMKMYNAVDQ